MSDIPHATETAQRLQRISSCMDSEFWRRCAKTIADMDRKQAYANIDGIDYGAQMRVKAKLEGLGYKVERRDDQRDGAYFLIRVDS